MTGEKKKLLFITYTYSLGGGAEKILTNIVNNLNPEKYDISILEYAHFDVKEEQINPNIKLLKPVVSMSGDNKFKRLWKNFQVYSYSGFLRKREEQYDLEISFNYLIPSFLLSRKAPAVSWFHGEISDLKTRHYHRWLQRFPLKYTSKIVTVSENSKQSIVDVYPEFKDKVQIIYNGFNIEEIRKASTEKTDIEIKKPAIAFVGRLEEGKAPLRLLDVLALLKSRGRLVHLYFCGQGDLKEKIENKAEELGLTEYVHLPGYLQNPYTVMKQCDAICMMSKAEGFPTVFAEGIALGVPFISTEVGGVRELSNGGKCGIIVNSVEECANAVEECVFDKEKHSQMKAACNEHIHNFDLKTQISNIESLFDEILLK